MDLLSPERMKKERRSGGHHPTGSDESGPSSSPAVFHQISTTRVIGAGLCSLTLLIDGARFEAQAAIGPAQQIVFLGVFHIGVLCAYFPPPWVLLAIWCALSNITTLVVVALATKWQTCVAALFLQTLLCPVSGHGVLLARRMHDAVTTDSPLNLTMKRRLFLMAWYVTPIVAATVHLAVMFSAQASLVEARNGPAEHVALLVVVMIAASTQALLHLTSLRQLLNAKSSGELVGIRADDDARGNDDSGRERTGSDDPDQPEDRDPDGSSSQGLTSTNPLDGKVCNPLEAHHAVDLFDVGTSHRNNANDAVAGNGSTGDVRGAGGSNTVSEHNVFARHENGEQQALPALTLDDLSRPAPFHDGGSRNSFQIPAPDLSPRPLRHNGTPESSFYGRPPSALGEPMNPNGSTSSVDLAFKNKALQHLDKKAVSAAVKKKPTYRKGPIIGRGAMSTVYVMLNEGTGEMMAAKRVVFPSSLTPAEIERRVSEIKKEIQVMKDLDHPHIVRYLFTDHPPDGWDSDKSLLPSTPRLGSSTTSESGTAFAAPSLIICMEYVSGGSMQDIIQNFGALSEVTAASFVAQMLLGLAYLAEQGIVHLDVKPANALVRNDGVVKISDFGTIAKFTDKADAAGALRGTPMFMAPEVIRGEPVTAAADVWSLGCTVFALLAGYPPWEHYGNSMKVMSDVASCSPDLIAYLYEMFTAHTFSAEAADFISQCLRFNPLERPTCMQLLSHPWIAQHDVVERSVVGEPPNLSISPEHSPINMQRRESDIVPVHDEGAGRTQMDSIASLVDDARTAGMGGNELGAATQRQVLEYAAHLAHKATKQLQRPSAFSESATSVS